MLKGTSKYIGTTINGWKVVDRESAPGNHFIYTLKTKKRFTIKTMKVRDNELTKFAKGKTIDQEKIGKDYQLSKNIRVIPNTIHASKSLFNLFRSI